MSKLQKVGNFFVFLVGGLVTIVVGFFMLRGTMNMWNKKDDSEKEPEK